MLADQTLRADGTKKSDRKDGFSCSIHGTRPCKGAGPGTDVDSRREAQACCVRCERCYRFEKVPLKLRYRSNRGLESSSWQFLAGMHCEQPNRRERVAKSARARSSAPRDSFGKPKSRMDL